MNHSHRTATSIYLKSDVVHRYADRRNAYAMPPNTGTSSCFGRVLTYVAIAAAGEEKKPPRGSGPGHDREL